MPYADVAEVKAALETCCGGPELNLPTELHRHYEAA